MYDERILGNGNFVDRVYNEIDDGVYYKTKDIDELITKIAKYYGVKKTEITETRKKYWEKVGNRYSRGEYSKGKRTADLHRK